MINKCKAVIRQLRLNSGIKEQKFWLVAGEVNNEYVVQAGKISLKSIVTE
jgi:hypothetical protein